MPRGQIWRPGAATCRECPAGYFELARQEEAEAEIAMFGVRLYKTETT